MIESYTSQETINRAAENAARFFSVDELNAERIRAAGRSARRAEAHRLVKASKSPTDRFPGLTGAYFNRRPPRRKPLPLELDQAAPHTAKDLTQPGTWAVIEKRDWCSEHRIRLETRPGSGVETPENAGDRWTSMLTERGAKKISESCYFMACQRGGFSTFATLTMNDKARARMTRQGLVNKFRMDAAGFPLPPETARAKPGSFSMKYDTSGETPAYNVAEINADWKPVTINDPKFGPLRYNPLKTGYVWSLQKEVSRFFEAAGKMYQRGWQYRRAIPGGMPRLNPETNAEFCPITGKWETVKVQGSEKCVATRRTATTEGNPVTWLADGPYTAIKFKAEPLGYLWVAENPNRTDDNGEPLPICDEHGEYDEHATNPHIHLMMKWRVDYRHFPYWARRLEKLWGHGFAHLEKIKDPQKAGSYVAKAAGYLTKGQGPENWQGEIRGNRYGISSRARAPGWIETDRHQVGMMGWLIAEAHELWSEKHGEKLQRREKLKNQLEAANDAPQRHKIGKLLEKVRGEIEPLPRISKYAALFKSETQKNQFLSWATRQGWEAKPQSSLWLSEWRKAQWLRREYRVITRIDEATLDRLAPDENEIIDWIRQADHGAACNDEDDHDNLDQNLHLQMLRA